MVPQFFNLQTNTAHTLPCTVETLDLNGSKFLFLGFIGLLYYMKSSDNSISWHNEGNLCLNIVMKKVSMILATTVQIYKMQLKRKLSGKLSFRLTFLDHDTLSNVAKGL